MDLLILNESLFKIKVYHSLSIVVHLAHTNWQQTGPMRSIAISPLWWSLMLETFRCRFSPCMLTICDNCWPCFWSTNIFYFLLCSVQMLSNVYARRKLSAVPNWSAFRRRAAWPGQPVSASVCVFTMSPWGVASECGKEIVWASGYSVGLFFIGLYTDGKCVWVLQIEWQYTYPSK